MHNVLYSDYWSNHQNIYKETLRALDKSTFIICAMFTVGNPIYLKYAKRLAHSCERYELLYSIYQIPAVHKSLHPEGIDNPSFTKANFILYNMIRFPGKNILYLDIDMFFVDYPERIFQISSEDYDFAIYNWLSDEHNEAYMPVTSGIEVGNRHSDFYYFSHSIDLYSSEQMLCSGGVQYYKNSAAARKLLEYWQTFVERYPDFADDEWLDYVYNNFILQSVDFKAYWLDKSYLRLPWWPHVKPAILHPGLPTVQRKCFITEVENRRRFYPEKCQRKSGAPFFPRDSIIDTRERKLIKIVNDQVVDSRPIDQEFWIYPENIGLE
jgi:hypothetical protein